MKGVFKAGLDLVCDTMTKGNGSCLFTAVTQQAKRPDILNHLYDVEKNGLFAHDDPETLRDFLSNFMMQSKDLAVLRMREHFYEGGVEGQTTWAEFWQNMAKPGVWGNVNVLQGLALYLETDINIVYDSGDVSKGSCQKRFSGIRPLRGGGYPPFPLRKKTFFFSH